MRNVILLLGLLLAYTFIYAGMSHYVKTGWFAAPHSSGDHAGRGTSGSSSSGGGGSPGSRAT